MISEKDIPVLYQKLKAQIARDFVIPFTGTSGGSATASRAVAWSDINFAYSSIGDITDRRHNLLTFLDSDGHTEYVRQAGRAGFSLIDAILRTRDPSNINYRSDHYITGGEAIINSYNDTGGAYTPVNVDGSTINLRPNANAALGLSVAGTGEVTAALSTATTHRFGYATIGEVGYGSLLAGFAYNTKASVGNYALLQDSAGGTYLNASPGQTVHIRQNDTNRLSFGGDGIWYSGLSTLNTDNYVSQLTGLHLGYDGSVDCRYLYTDQLHAKAFIADLEQALAGGQIITKSVTILDETFTALYPGVPISLIVKDLPSAHGMQVFQANDFIRLRQFSRSGGSLDITDCWGQVTSPTDNGDGTQTWTFTRSGTATYNTITLVNVQGASQSSSTTNAVTKPTGTALGHVMVATVCYNGAPTITPPTGWSLMRPQTATTGVALSIYYKLAGSSEPSTYTWTFNIAVNSSITIGAYSGCHQVYHVDDSNAQANGSGTSMIAPTVTPQSLAGMLLFCGATQNVRATPPAGMTERNDTGTGSVGSYLAEQLLSSASPTGSKTATLASGSFSVGALVMLKPSYTALSTTAGQIIPYSTIAPDAIVLDYGVSGNGFAEVNAIDGNYGTNSPYYQIVTWTTHPTNQTLKMRLGNLAGITDAVFGSFAGKYGLYTSDGYFKGAAAFGSGSNIILDSNGAAVTMTNDLTWAVTGSIATYKTVSIDTFQSYAFKDGSTYTAGLGGGKASGKDTLILYNQQHNVNKESSVVIDSRFSSTGGPTYDQPARVTLATSRWFPDLGVQHFASLELLSTAGNVDKITLIADTFLLNTTPITADSGALNTTGTLGSAWTALSYTNAGGTTWTDYGAPFQTGQYKKIGDIVKVRGMCKRTAGAGTTIATLPSGYRPPAQIVRAVDAVSAYGSVSVDTSGNIALVTGGSGNVALEFEFSTI